MDKVTFQVNEKQIDHTQQMNFGLSPHVRADSLLIVFCTDTGGAGSIQVELPVTQAYYKEVDGKEVSLASRDPAIFLLIYSPSTPAAISPTLAAPNCPT